MYIHNTEQRRRTEVRALADRLYRERYPYLLRIALKNAASRDDAEEAVNEAFASFIRAFDPASDAPPLAWLTLSAKRDCWRRYRAQHLDRSAGQEAERGGEGPGALIDSIPSRASGPAQLIAQVDEARTKLAALKPAERRALGLIAAGYSYREVGEITGWTYTKANRCASEGRATLQKQVAA